MHINGLELKAIYLTIKHFLPQMKDHYVLIRTDNTTCVQYILKEGGTIFPSTMLSRVGTMASSKSQQHSVRSSSFSRNSKCPS